MELSYEIKGADEIIAAFKQAPIIASQELNKAIKEAILNFLAQARIEAPVDRGFLRGVGMQTIFGFLKGTLRNTADYAFWVHEGTKPGHFPPISAIAPWARRHKIPAFLVARKIFREGTKGVPFFKLALDKRERQVDSIFIKALENIINRLTE